MHDLLEFILINILVAPFTLKRVAREKWLTWYLGNKRSSASDASVIRNQRKSEKIKSFEEFKTWKMSINKSELEF